MNSFVLHKELPQFAIESCTSDIRKVIHLTLYSNNLFAVKRVEREINNPLRIYIRGLN